MLDLRTLGTMELLDGNGELVISGPKPLALLTYLLIEGEGSGISRDLLQALLWPDSPRERAQHGLRQALYSLRRRDAGASAITSAAGMVRADPDLIRCDASIFMQACRESPGEGALALYRGDFLAGTHLREAPEWESWADGVRERLRRMAAESAAGAVAEAIREGRIPDALSLARHRISLAPFEEAGHRTLMELLARTGDGSEALRAYRSLVRMLKRELDASPSEPTQELARRIGAGDVVADHVPADFAIPVAPPDTPSPAKPPEAAPGPWSATDSGPPAPPPPAAIPSSPRTSDAGGAPRRRVAGWGFAAMAALAASFILFEGGEDPTPLPLMAVTTISDLSATAGERGWTGADMELWLEGALERAPGLRVVGMDRLVEVAPRSAGGGLDRTLGALRAGADLGLEGEIQGADNPTLLMDLRAVDLRSGEVRYAWRLSGSSPEEVIVAGIDSLLLTVWGVSAPSSSAQGVSGAHGLIHGSVAALRFYHEGLQAYYDGDLPGAQILFRAALSEDPNFAIAAYRLHRSLPDGPEAWEALESARSLAPTAPERDRLRIEAAWAHARSEADALERAQRLVERYPHDPDGLILLGSALHLAGRYAEAAARLESVVESDSLGLSGQLRECRGCDAMAALVATSLAMGDGVRAKAWAQAAVDARPHSARGWRDLAWVQWRVGEYQEALESRARASELQPAVPDDIVFPAVVHLRAGRFDEARAMLVELANRAEGDLRRTVLWWQIQYLRERGRRDEAVDLAVELRRNSESARPGHAMGSTHVLHAITLMERGDFSWAAALFDSVGVSQMGTTPSRAHELRQLVWLGTQSAHARVMGGDTLGLQQLADSLRVQGIRTGYVRDRVMHHHLRGLLLEARGDMAGAEREYRSAHFSGWSNYVLSSVRLAEVLRARGRAEEALEVLENALRGPALSVGLYATRAELKRQKALTLVALHRRQEASRFADYAVQAWEGGPRALPPHDLLRTLAGEHSGI